MLPLVLMPLTVSRRPHLPDRYASSRKIPSSAAEFICDSSVFRLALKVSWNEKYRFFMQSSDTNILWSNYMELAPGYLELMLCSRECWSVLKISMIKCPIYFLLGELWFMPRADLMIYNAAGKSVDDGWQSIVKICKWSNIQYCLCFSEDSYRTTQYLLWDSRTQPQRVGDRGSPLGIQKW